VAKTAYFDAFSGLSGDMLVGAFIDLGVNFDELRTAVEGLPLSGYRLSANRKTVSGIAAVKFEVEILEPQPERHLGEILDAISSSCLPTAVVARAKRIFEGLAEAEGKVHRTTLDHVHFHEVGAVDSIIDIVGTAFAVEQLEIADIMVSTLPLGAGVARSRHGIIPVPAPATVELLADFPVRFGDGDAEMVTPTGAAVVRALARPVPAGLTFKIERVGYGAGSRSLKDRPNVLRVFIGERHAAYGADELLQIETNIDDLNPQIYDHLTMRLLAAGARDVTLTPTIMKKGRPGVLVAILAPETSKDALTAILFEETSTIGLRFHPVARLKLERRTLNVDTRFGAIQVKLSGKAGEAPITITPEYDECRRAAETHHVPLRLVMDEVCARARAQLTIS
jgi:uncharacterized protein (TIGR00299 family) protein